MLAIQFTELINPTELTTSLALLIISFTAIFGYLAWRLRNPLIFFSWTLKIIVFVLVLMIQLDFIWYWVMVIVCGLTIAIVAGFNYVLVPARGG